MPPSESAYDVAILDGARAAIPLAVGGLPSPQSIFAVHCVADIVRRTQRGAKVIPLNTGEDGEKLAEATLDEPVLPFFDTPDRHARATLLAAQIPIVVVTGDFAEAARFCMAARDLDALQAARFVSQSYSCLEPLYRHGHVNRVALNKAASLAEWIDEVAAWLGLQPSAWQAARQEMLVDYAAWPTVEAAMHGLVQFADPSSSAWDRLSASDEALFEALGRFYHSGPIDTVFWPPECLVQTAVPAIPTAGAISLTGPARILTSGPFLHLPPGRWSARYQFEVDDHPAGNRVEFDVVHGGVILVSHGARINEAGRFGFDCTFEMDESRLPVENRAILVEGSIGGLFKALGIWLNRNE